MKNIFAKIGLGGLCRNGVCTSVNTPVRKPAEHHHQQSASRQAQVAWGTASTQATRRNAGQAHGACLDDFDELDDGVARDVLAKLNEAHSIYIAYYETEEGRRQDNKEPVRALHDIITCIGGPRTPAITGESSSSHYLLDAAECMHEGMLQVPEHHLALPRALHERVVKPMQPLMEAQFKSIAMRVSERDPLLAAGLVRILARRLRYYLEQPTNDGLIKYAIVPGIKICIMALGGRSEPVARQGINALTADTVASGEDNNVVNTIDPDALYVIRYINVAVDAGRNDAPAIKLGQGGGRGKAKRGNKAKSGKANSNKADAKACPHKPKVTRAKVMYKGSPHSVYSKDGKRYVKVWSAAQKKYRYAAI